MRASEPDDIERMLRAFFPFAPTPSQDRLLHVLARFVASGVENCLLIVRGYAGTGKTTTVNALVETLERRRVGYELLAPTGRAAKVLSNYSGKRALTIHKRIYRQERSESGGLHFVPAPNRRTHTVFVVDEASMIGGADYASGRGNLLDDLFDFVYSRSGCKLILIGDDAQLPPVGTPHSPALDLGFLKSRFSVAAAMSGLTDVTRQKLNSGILSLATAIREGLFAEDVWAHLPFAPPEDTDVEMLSGHDLQDRLEEAFGDGGVEGAMLITRSNKRANLFNKQVRARVFFREEEIEGGDLIMAVKNNYHWLDEKSRAGFIANGDVMEVMRIGRREEWYGLHFAHATVRMVDYPDEPEVDTVLWLDALDVDAASMPREATERLYRGTMESYADLPTKAARQKAMRQDPFYNALQVKFAYAVTCHKAQGGQWPHVFVDQGYLTDDMIDTEYLRWLYTAVTRATKKLYLLNFSPNLVGRPAED